DQNLESYLRDSGINFPSIRISSKKSIGRIASLEGSNTGSIPHVTILNPDGSIAVEGPDPGIVYQVAKLIRGEAETIP
ncbi:MAG: hypothetical protein AAGA96_10945, partial [Verrucomicrobiota bacterium]